MAKYQPKIFINNPEKNVPADIVNQFFTAIKTADIDRIRDFANKYKNKYNIIEKNIKGSSYEIIGTPFHAVLELDEKIADNKVKLIIMEYLADMGAPMDLPNSSNIWPIHLAVNTQSDKIIDFFVRNHVSLDRKDSSNNTPLHYAMYGREIECPKSTKIRDIVPKQTFDKLPLNKSLTNINTKLISLINDHDEIKADVIHVINTIAKIPEIYANDKIGDEIINDVISIFVEAATKPNFIEGTVTSQQNKLDQTIDRMYSIINNNLLKGLTNTMDISPNNRGWGPLNLAENYHILDNTIPNLKNVIEKEYLQLKNSILTTDNTLDSDFSVSKIINQDMVQIFNNINKNLINVVFSPSYTTTTNFAILAEVKMVYLLYFSYYINNYTSYLIDNIFQVYYLFGNDDDYFNTLLANSFVNNVNNYTPYVNKPSSLYNKTFPELILSDNFNTIRNLIDVSFVNAAVTSNCLTQQVRRLFTTSNDRLLDINKLEYGQQTNELKGLLSIKMFKAKENNILSQQDFQKYQSMFNKIIQKNKNYKPDMNWFEMLNTFIKTLAQPIISTHHNMFTNRAIGGTTHFRALAKYDKLPKTPFPYSGNNNITGADDKYTILELFRIMDAIESFLKTGDYDITRTPEILRNNTINGWHNHVNIIANINNIGNNYPEFIFLYKVLVEYAYLRLNEVTETCLDKIFRDSINSGTDNAQTLSIYLTNVMDSTMWRLLLPYSIKDDEDNNNIIAQYDIRWDDNMVLMPFFDTIIKNRADINIYDYVDIIYPRIPDITNIPEHLPYLNDYTYINDLRKKIEIDASKPDKIYKILDIMQTNPPNVQQNLRSLIRTFFGIDAKTSPINQNIIVEYDKLTDIIEFDFDESIFENALRESDSDDTDDTRVDNFYIMTEYYASWFTYARGFMNNVLKLLTVLANIISDINTAINDELYYYVPQIFLPTIILLSTRIILMVLSTKDEFINTQINMSKLYDNYVDKTRPAILFLMEQSKQFITSFPKSLDRIIQYIQRITKYHNNVVDFLNFHSGHQLINSRKDTTHLQHKISQNIFINNLPTIEPMPDTITELATLSSALAEISNRYYINENKYFNSGQSDVIFNQGVFYHDDDDDSYPNYRGIRDTERINGSIVSNSPTSGMNSQLNLTIQDDGVTYTIHNVESPIAGPLIKLDLDNSKQGFDNGFIAYESNPYNFSWLNGMPPSIKRVMNRHLSIIKQQIVQNIIQYIADNQHTGGDASMIELFDDVKKLGNSPDYLAISDAKVYVVIGKLVDAILNRLFEYSTRQTIANWIISMVSKDNNYVDIVDMVNDRVKIIQEKNYLRLSLKEVNYDAITQVLNNDATNIDYKLVQIESDPKNVKYVSNTQSNLIHYLYSINYYSDSGTINSNKKCYEINTKIIPRLISNSNINSKNSDGNTPLHLAVEMRYPLLVDILLKNGAKPFKNLRGLTPQDMVLDMFNHHNKYTDGNNIVTSINEFVYIFNDLLYTRLSDDKYGNNIIKNINLAIPLQLVMYNHMFFIYLKNYRYGFSYELRQDFENLIKKYISISTDTYTYPFDIFIINDINKLSYLVSEDDEVTRANNNYNNHNSRDVKRMNKQMSMIVTQINGLKNEYVNTQDAEQKTMLRDLYTALENERINIEAKISALVKPVTNNDLPLSYLETYQDNVNNMIKSINRGYTLIEFYENSFSKIGNTKNFYLKLWEQYLQKDLTDAPSMLFSLNSKLLEKILDHDKPVKSDIKVMVDLYEHVKNYIENKNPNGSLDDDPLLVEEVSQIIYLINLIITPAIRSIILAHVVSGLQEMNTLNVLSTDETEVVRSILDTKFNGNTIDTFLSNVLPSMAVKFFTQIYNNDYDTDRRILSSSDLFLPIIQIIKANRMTVLNDDSILIKNIREYLIPFMVNTYQSFIHHIRLSIYAYERYLLNTYQLLKLTYTLN